LHGVKAEPPRSMHERLSVPVLLLLANGADMEGFKERVPQAVVEPVEAGHDIVEDAPAETVRLIADWLGLG
jgi:hypothetical protein